MKIMETVFNNKNFSHQDPKMIKISLTAVSSLILTLLLSINSHGGNDALKNVYEMRTITFGILGDFYMFSGLEGDSRYNREIEAGIKRFEKHLEIITQDGAPTAKLDTLAYTIQHWQSYRELLDANRNDFLAQGYSNARMVDKLGKKASDLNSSLGQMYDALIANNQSKVSKLTQDTRDMGLIIQTITAEYAARSTSSLGQVMVIDINEGGMDQQGKKFQSLLEKMKIAAKDNKKLHRVMDQIGIKWVFIAKSIANYNENAVPFIVNSYGDRITQNLETVGNHFQTVAAK